MLNKPIVYVIAGPNGSGKTTFATEFLPKLEGCREFVNADYIATGLSPFSPEQAALEAGKLVLRRIKEFSNAGKSFGFETTLAGRSYTHLLKNMKRSGYQVRIYFLWLRSVDLALRRIADRVRHGGHDIPEMDVRRRYTRGLYNLFAMYLSLADYAAIIDNSDKEPRMLATYDAGTLREDFSGALADLRKTTTLSF